MSDDMNEAMPKDERMEPKIKLRDGWTWEQDDDAWYAASDRGRTYYEPSTGMVWSTGDEPLADVVLAVIEANAPEVLRKHIAGLATPVPEGECPRHYEVYETDDYIIDTPRPEFGYVRVAAVGFGLGELYDKDDDGDPDFEPEAKSRSAVAAAVAHRSAVAADCYFDLVARIAELESALRAAAERERDALDDRDAAWSRTAELQHEVDALRSACAEPSMAKEGAA